MTTRWVNVCFLLLVLAAGAGYLAYSRVIAERLNDNLGPILFPVALGAGVVILSLIELVRAFRASDAEEDAPFRIPNLWRLIATVVLIAAHFLAWWGLGQFYPATAVMFVALVLVFRGSLAPREIGTAVAVAVPFTLALYLVFQVAFGISLN